MMESTRQAVTPEDNKGVDADLTGRDRMIRNVLTGWGGHVVLIVTGFVMPRMIDHHLGQAILGVWDLCWSIVNYFDIAGLAIGSSVNRYVAGYRAVNDVDGIRRAVSSVMCVQLAAAGLIVLTTAAVVWALPVLSAGRLGAGLPVARSVVVLLGASVAIQMTFDVFRGVITGCHRWDLYNGLNAGSHAATVAGMMMALSLGGGLHSLALVHLSGVVLTEVVRSALAYKVCPELRLRPAYVEWPQVRRMLVFGGKTTLEGMAGVVLTLGSSLLVATYLGPAVLAVFSRPAALLRHAFTLINKFALVLTPTASSLQVGGRDTELRELLIDGTRYAAFLTLPMMLILAILGDPILELWMGPGYQAGSVLLILTAGYFLPICQRPLMSVLIGMNFHGPVGIVTLGMAFCGVGFGILAVGALGWGLAGVALAVALPVMIGNGFFLAGYACRRLGISLTEYFRRAFLGPVACAFPFALSLAVIRTQFGGHPLLAIVFGGVAGLAILGPLYWRHVAPPWLRERIVSFVGGPVRQASFPRG